MIEIKIVRLLTQLFGISIYHEDQNAYQVWSNHIEEYGAGEWGFKKSSFQSDSNNVYLVLVKSSPRKVLTKKSQKAQFFG